MSRPAPAAAPSDQPHPRRYWWLARLTIAFAALFAFDVALRLWWEYEADRRTAAYVAAARARGEVATVDDVNRPANVPDADNAALPLIKAAAALTTMTPAQRRWENEDVGPAGPTTRQAKLLEPAAAENATALAGVEAVIDRRRADWQVTLTSPVMMAAQPHLGPQRHLSNALKAAALLDRHRGDHAAAVGRLRVVFRQADAVQHLPPSLLPHLTSTGQIALAAEQAAELARDIAAGGGRNGPATRPASDADVAALIGDLLDESAFRAGGVRAWHGERVAALDSVGPVYAATRGLSRPLAWVWRPVMKLDALGAARRTDAVAAAVAAPTRPQAAARLPVDVRWAGPALAEALRVFSGFLRSSYARAVEAHYRGLAERRAAAVQLAIALHRRDHHGAFPPALDALVPRYLPAVPRDPLAAGDRPLGYRGGGGRPIVYSAGANGVDDGGDDALPAGVTANVTDEWNQRRPDRVWDLLPRPAAGGADGASPEGQDDGGDEQPAADQPADDDAQ